MNIKPEHIERLEVLHKGGLTFCIKLLDILHGEAIYQYVYLIEDVYGGQFSCYVEKTYYALDVVEDNYSDDYYEFENCKKDFYEVVPKSITEIRYIGV